MEREKKDYGLLGSEENSYRNPLWRIYDSDVREERPYACEDFKKEYFIPNL